MTSLLIALLLTCGPDGKGGTTCTHQHPPGQQAAKEGECNHPAPAASGAPTAAAILTRGEKLKGAPAVEFKKLLESPAEFDGKTVAVEAKVRRACQKKGCWMELGGEEGPGVRVTFKDYGFFVPLDSAGSTAKVEGVIKVTVLDEARAKHYEAEGAKVPKDKDGKYREVQMVALGVELRK